MSSCEPLISVIIPTHNRECSLKRLLDNIFALKSKVNFEIIVVDNNSKDETRKLVKSYGKIVYVFEKNTSFTSARHSGAISAKGSIFLYLDDDVIVNKGTLEEIQQIFCKNLDCGVAGGKILPLFEESPSEWVSNLQKSFNGLSLFDLGEESKEVPAVPGPMMAIRRSAYDKVGGFPPDTIGVETNTARKTFKKIYIGPGDHGICFLCRQAGYKILYSPKMCVHHVIPSVRLTKTFWISRMKGEGQCNAITGRCLPALLRVEGWFLNLKVLLRYYLNAKIQRLKGDKSLLLPDEIWVEYYKSLLKMSWILFRNPELAKYLWNLGYDGISDEKFDVVLKEFPRAYRRLILR